jgi:hypothetical protein
MGKLPVDYIDRKLHEKIFLYNELLQCFHREKMALINMDLDSLWNISKNKDELCARIDSVRLELSAKIHSESGMQNMANEKLIELVPEDAKPRFHALFITLRKLKAEIGAIRKTNMDTAVCSLKFLDEIILIISGQIRQEFIYNDRCGFDNTGRNMFLSREV